MRSQSIGRSKSMGAGATGHSHDSIAACAGFFYANKEPSMDKITAFFAKLSAPFEWVVQKVRNYPKGAIIASIVLIVLARIA